MNNSPYKRSFDWKQNCGRTFAINLRSCDWNFVGHVMIDIFWGRGAGELVIMVMLCILVILFSFVSV